MNNYTIRKSYITMYFLHLFEIILLKMSSTTLNFEKQHSLRSSETIPPQPPSHLPGATVFF